jgi:ADP-ribosylglycohydrolase
MHSNEMTEVKSRCLGAFVGLAIGDALGAPVEFRRRGMFTPVTGMRAGGTFGLPSGAWTDDTAMALCLADSLLHNPEFDVVDLLERFCDWMLTGTNTSTGKSIGIGQNTLRTLGNYRRTGETTAIKGGKRSDGNGAIMRLAAVPCMHWQNVEKARSIAIAQSQCTHHSPLSEGCCDLMTFILCQLISGKIWEQILPYPNKNNWLEEVSLLSSCNWRDKSEEEVQSTGYVIHTLEAALWCVDTTNSFQDAVLRAVNLGEDADTVGAVTGQIAGARYGIESIPDEWLSELVDQPRIKTIAEIIFNRSLDLV